MQQQIGQWSRKNAREKVEESRAERPGKQSRIGPRGARRGVAEQQSAILFSAI
jgi:hypothetical protein